VLDKTLDFDDMTPLTGRAVVVGGIERANPLSCAHATMSLTDIAIASTGAEH
jgi:hypothetical protein